MRETLERLGEEVSHREIVLRVESPLAARRTVAPGLGAAAVRAHGGRRVVGGVAQADLLGGSASAARRDGIACYASVYVLSSSATSSFTIFIIASITLCTFLGSLSLMSSMKRLGTICQVMPN